MDVVRRWPESRPVLRPAERRFDADGNLIVADAGNSQLQRLSPRGEVLGNIPLVVAPDAPADRRPAPAGLAFDEQGSLYVMDTGIGRVLKMAPDGTILATWEAFGLSGTATGHVAVGGGYLYIAAFAYGNRHTGISSTSTLERISLATGERTKLAPDPRRWIRGVVVDPDGFLYIAEHESISGAGNIRKFSPSGETVATWDQADGEKLVRPSWLTMSPDGNLYAVDNDGFLVRAFTRDGTFLGVWHTASVYGIAVDGDGVIYGAAGSAIDNQAQIIRLAPTGETLEGLGVRGDAPGVIERIAGIATDDAHRVYVLSLGTLHQFSPSGAALTARSLRDVNFPFEQTSLVVDTSGDIYVAVGTSRTAIRVAPDNRVVGRWAPPADGQGSRQFLQDFAVTPGSTIVMGNSNGLDVLSQEGEHLFHWMASDDGGTSSRSQSTTINRVAVDRAGQLYAADQSYVYTLTPDGQLLARWGAAPSDDPDAQVHRLRGVSDIAVDDRGFVYLGLLGQPSVRMLGPDGAVLAVWGASDIMVQPVPGEYAVGQLITVDREGNVYVASSQRIWRLACTAS